MVVVVDVGQRACMQRMANCFNTFAVLLMTVAHCCLTHGKHAFVTERHSEVDDVEERVIDVNVATPKQGQATATATAPATTT